MSNPIRCLILAGALLCSSTFAHAQDTIDYTFVCSEKIREISHRSMKPAVCNAAGALSAAFSVDENNKLGLKVKECDKTKNECLTKLNSAKFANRLKKVKSDCFNKSAKPAYTCSLSTDVVSDCVDQIISAFKRIAPYSCNTLLTSPQAQKRLSKVHPSCELLKKTCPDVMDALSLGEM